VNSKTILRYAAVLGFFTSLIAPSLALAIGETTGRVAGYVYDPTGSPLAEVPLTISGPLLLQPISRSSGDDGRFEFDELPPGSGYVIEVSIPGFSPVKEAGITVEVGRASAVDVHLTVLTESAPAQTIEIVERVNPIINPDSAESVSVVTIEKAATTPIFNQVEAMPELAPGVYALSTTPSSMGGLKRWGHFYVDGMDTTDAISGSISAPMDFYSVENFEILTGGFEAQYNSMGMVENAVTKRGSNDFKYDIIGIISPSFMSAHNLTGGGSGYAANQGILVNSPLPQPATSFYSPIVNLGGPIIKDKLWFYGSLQANFSDREVPLNLPAGPVAVGNPNAVGNRPVQSDLFLARLNLTWQPDAADRLSLSYHHDQNIYDNYNAGFGIQTQDGEQKVNRWGNWVVFNWDHNLSDKVLFQLTSGFTFKQECDNPEQRVASTCYDSNNDDPKRAAHVDSSNDYFAQFNMDEIGSGQVGNYQFLQQGVFVFDPTLSAKLGNHQLKMGLQFTYMFGTETSGVDGMDTYTNPITRTSMPIDRWVDESPNPGGICDPVNNPVACYEAQQFFNSAGQAAPLTTSANVRTTGVFLQDRWTPTRNLTIIPGIRVDWGRLYGDPSLGDHGFLTNLVGFGPRLGATYDIFGNRKSLIVAHAGRSNDVGNLYIAQHANPSLTLLQSSFNYSNNTFPICTLQNAATTAGCSIQGGPSGRYFSMGSTSLTPPHTDEVSAGFHQAIASEAAVGLDFTYDYYGNLFEEQEVNQIWDATGTRVIGYVNPAQPGPIYKVYTPDSAYRQYYGMNIWAEGTAGPFDILASYTLSYDWGTSSDYFDTYLANPRFEQLWTGYVNNDTRHMLKAAITYKAPFGVDVGTRIRYLTGTPLWESFTNYAGSASGSSTFWRSPQGTCFIYSSTNNVQNFSDPTSWTECRNPDTFLLDLTIRYNIGQTLSLKDHFGAWADRAEITLLIVDILNNYETYSTTAKYTPGTFNRFGYATSSTNGPFQAEIFLRVRN
jgi:hypothetical protein